MLLIYLIVSVADVFVFVAQVPWELKPYRAALYYDAELNEFEKPAPPKFVDLGVN